MTSSDFRTIENCDEIEENASVKCFHFVFDATEGFSYAVGFFGVAVAYIAVYNNTVIWVTEKILSLNSKTAKIVCLGICFIILLFTPLCSLIIYPIFSAVPLFHDSVLNTDAKALKLLAYICFVAYNGILLPMFVPSTVYKHHQKLNNDRNVQVENPGQEDDNPGQEDEIPGQEDENPGQKDENSKQQDDNPEPEDENTALLKKH